MSEHFFFRFVTKQELVVDGCLMTNIDVYVIIKNIWGDKLDPQLYTHF